MDLQTKLTYLTACYSFMQLSLQDVKLLDDKGRPIKKKRSMSEQDAIAIYSWLSDQLKNISIHELRTMASKTDIKVSKLLNDHQVVNNFLLSIMLLREYIDEHGDSIQKILIGNKINRIIDLLDDAVTDEAFDPEIKRTTGRTARNIYRQFTDRPQRSDDVLQAHFKRIKHGMV